jgi:ribosome biogenesis GTPase / thiamine phosphate phosphatase
MSTHRPSLLQLGWSALFAQQLTLEDLRSAHPARVTSVRRNGFVVLSERGAAQVVAPAGLIVAGQAPATVGDWVLVENDAPRMLRVLERRSLIARMAAGLEQRRQLIAANVDTLFVVTSCNHDFNPSRLERYLAVAHEAHVEPVIVLTKIDLCADSDAFVSCARRVAHSVEVVAVDATSPSTASALQPWLSAGQTVMFAGSSGVGKSTLVNTLLGTAEQATAGIREDDSRGRHTTTSRQMFALPAGAWVIDTPGMRELKVGSVDSGLSVTFADVGDLANECRFRDCDHQHVVGCALIAAVESGVLDARRLENYLKLQRESARASRTLHEQREIERRWGRIHRTAQRQRRKDRGR